MELAPLLDKLTEAFRQNATSVIERFTDTGPTAQKTEDLENDLFEHLRDLGRQLIESVFSYVEPEVEDRSSFAK